MANSWNDISLGTLYTTAISHDATAATIEGLLEAIYGVGEVTVVDDTDYTITFSMDTGDSDLTADFALLTGSTDPALTITQAYVGVPLTGTNNGTKPCDCIIRLDVIADRPGVKITLAETGEYVDLDRALVIGDVVIWDTSTRYITINGVDARQYVDFDSTWFKLPVGAFTLNADPVDVQIRATFRQRWI